MGTTGAEHWDRVYGDKADDETSWYEAAAQQSLAMVDRLAVEPARSVVDVGGGTSRLVDQLMARGHRDLTVLDVSAQAIHRSKARLGDLADAVDWIVADITAWEPERRYDVWHDRAVFHFLTTPEGRAAYRHALRAALSPSGVFIVATFAPTGPAQCSGLPVSRYDAKALHGELGPGVRLLAQDEHEHRTPWGTTQPFTWVAGQLTG